jgi:hypothetical protein
MIWCSAPAASMRALRGMSLRYHSIPKRAIHIFIPVPLYMPMNLATATAVIPNSRTAQQHAKLLACARCGCLPGIRMASASKPEESPHPPDNFSKIISCAQSGNFKPTARGRWRRGQSTERCVQNNRGRQTAGGRPLETHARPSFGFGNTPTPGSKPYRFRFSPPPETKACCLW